MVFTAGEERKKERRRAWPTLFFVFLLTAARGPMRRQTRWRVGRRATSVLAVLWLHRIGPSTVMKFLNDFFFVILELFNVIFCLILSFCIL